MSYLLDTDILISFLKDKYSVAEKIDHIGIENVKHLERAKGLILENWRDSKFNEFL
jgi:predicted nucleic acid-binding protein